MRMTIIKASDEKASHLKKKSKVLLKGAALRGHHPRGYRDVRNLLICDFMIKSGKEFFPYHFFR